VAAQIAGEASTVAVDAETFPVGDSKKMEAPMATQKASAASTTTVNAGRTLGRADKNMASLVTVDAVVPPVRADKKMAALMAAGKEDAA
jgi:hypothetical protein